MYLNVQFAVIACGIYTHSTCHFKKRHREIRHEEGKSCNPYSPWEHAAKIFQDAISTLGPTHFNLCPSRPPRKLMYMQPREITPAGLSSVHLSTDGRDTTIIVLPTICNIRTERYVLVRSQSASHKVNVVELF